MKKLCAIIFALFFIVCGVYFYDMYSGYSLSKYVQDFFYDSNEEVTFAPAEKTDRVSDGQLSHHLYNSLTDDEKDMYNAIYNGISSHKAKIFVGFKPIESADEVFSVFQAVLYEHPELFWVNNGASYSTGGYLTVDYIYNREEARSRQQLIEQRADEILATVRGNEYDISLTLFDYIVSITEYDYDNVHDLANNASLTTIEGVLLNGKAVCSGYAKAYQYLLHRAGIGAIYITGEAVANGKVQNHGWVCQEICGEYYFSDPTWCDAFEGKTVSDFISHTYFCITGDEIAATHTIDERFGAISATATEYNYYVREELCFDKYNANDIRLAIINSIEQNPVGIELKFSNDEAYNTAFSALIERGEIYIVLKSVDLFSVNIDTNNISYSNDDTHRVLTIIFEKN